MAPGVNRRASRLGMPSPRSSVHHSRTASQLALCNSYTVVSQPSIPGRPSLPLPSLLTQEANTSTPSPGGLGVRLLRVQALGA
jgi:hypothetical protein